MANVIRIFRHGNSPLKYFQMSKLNYHVVINKHNCIVVSYIMHAISHALSDPHLCKALQIHSGTEIVNDQGGGSGQLGLRAGGAKNIWVKRAAERWHVD